MEKLIKIQAVITKIEDLIELQTNHRTVFDYKDYKHLKIECYSKEHAMKLMMLLGDTRETLWYFLGNTTIEIIDYMD